MTLYITLRSLSVIILARYKNQNTHNAPDSWHAHDASWRKAQAKKKNVTDPDRLPIPIIIPLHARYYYFRSSSNFRFQRFDLLLNDLKETSTIQYSHPPFRHNRARALSEPSSSSSSQNLKIHRFFPTMRSLTTIWPVSWTSDLALLIGATSVTRHLKSSFCHSQYSHHHPQTPKWTILQRHLFGCISITRRPMKARRPVYWSSHRDLLN